MPQTAQEAAESLFAMLPLPVSPATAGDYGIEAAPEQIQQITREMLSLNLFWLHQALTTVLSKPDGDRVFNELCRCVQAHWSTTLGLEGHDEQDYLKEADSRRQVYGRISREGGSPVAVFTETVEILESAWAIRTEDRQKILALLLDTIPVEEIGEMVESLDLTRQ
jgi:hypothetical protein